MKRKKKKNMNEAKKLTSTSRSGGRAMIGKPLNLNKTGHKTRDWVLRPEEQKNSGR
jgi:hypothetical protein